jgi:hypothetical protein
MTATWTLDDTLTTLYCEAMTAREMISTPHVLDPTYTEATLWSGEVYHWNKRRGIWILHEEPRTAGHPAP